MFDNLIFNDMSLKFIIAAVLTADWCYFDLCIHIHVRYVVVLIV